MKEIFLYPLKRPRWPEDIPSHRAGKWPNSWPELPILAFSDENFWWKKISKFIQPKFLLKSGMIIFQIKEGDFILELANFY